ncbi:MAG: indole-3-glycerol phosphate synthase TrpC [Leptolyngbyaceae cyanobacterium MO_188.B28]|nr:indole-3-glycerol phosphate synthase TrpC [Leptolyngbyaceae cyanobacterium MO_188.B28]
MKIRRRPPAPTVSVKNIHYQVKTPDSEPRKILEEIIWHKEVEVRQMREKLPLADLQRKVLTAPSPRDFLQALRQGKTQPALIAEVKKASPSKGVIRADFDPVAIAQAYVEGGATCLSVLTDKKFFQGDFQYLAQIRAEVDLPLLCKDFLIYPYQIYQARVSGADAVLLIAAVLSDEDLRYFVRIAKALGMNALVEVHTLEELNRVLAIEEIKLVGINNRNLEDFTTNLDTTCQLIAHKHPQIQMQDILIVSESGIHHSEHLRVVSEAGAEAVLVGESLMKQPDPRQGIAALFAEI